MTHQFLHLHYNDYQSGSFRQVCIFMEMQRVAQFFAFSLFFIPYFDCSFVISLFILRFWGETYKTHIFVCVRSFLLKFNLFIFFFFTAFSKFCQIGYLFLRYFNDCRCNFHFCGNAGRYTVPAFGVLREECYAFIYQH